MSAYPQPRRDLRQSTKPLWRRFAISPTVQATPNSLTSKHNRAKKRTAALVTLALLGLGATGNAYASDAVILNSLRALATSNSDTDNIFYADDVDNADNTQDDIYHEPADETTGEIEPTEPIRPQNPIVVWEQTFAAPTSLADVQASQVAAAEQALALAEAGPNALADVAPFDVVNPAAPATAGHFYLLRTTLTDPEAEGSVVVEALTSAGAFQVGPDGLLGFELFAQMIPAPDLPLAVTGEPDAGEGSDDGEGGFETGSATRLNHPQEDGAAEDGEGDFETDTDSPHRFVDESTGTPSASRLNHRQEDADPEGNGDVAEESPDHPFYTVTFDRLEILDVTPSVHLEFAPDSIVEGDAATLSIVIVNTTELPGVFGPVAEAMDEAAPAVQLAVDLPEGIVVADEVLDSCRSGSIVAEPGDTAIGINANLGQGQVDCTMTVEVSATEPGTYPLSPEDFDITQGVHAPTNTSVLTVTSKPEQQIAEQQKEEPDTEQPVSEAGEDKLTNDKNDVLSTPDLDSDGSIQCSEAEYTVDANCEPIVAECAAVKVFADGECQAVVECSYDEELEDDECIAFVECRDYEDLVAGECIPAPSVEIEGEPVVGEVLTATVENVEDEFELAWFANGLPIAEFLEEIRAAGGNDYLASAIVSAATANEEGENDQAGADGTLLLADELVGFEVYVQVQVADEVVAESEPVTVAGIDLFDAPIALAALTGCPTGRALTVEDFPCGDFTGNLANPAPTQAVCTANSEQQLANCIASGANGNSVNTAGISVVINVTQPINVTQTKVIDNGKQIWITSGTINRGAAFTNGQLFTVGTSGGGAGTLTLGGTATINSLPTGVTNPAGNGNQTALIKVDYGSTFNLDYGATLDGQGATWGANPAQAAGNYTGAAIYASYASNSAAAATVNLTGGSIKNFYTYDLSPVHIWHSNLTINGSVFDNNHLYTDVQDFNGGALNVTTMAGIAQTVTINNAIFRNNTSNRNSGAVYLNAVPSVTINNTLFDGNLAGFDFSGNQVPTAQVPTDFGPQYSGGAIYFQTATTSQLNNSLFVENQAVQHGGAIYHLTSGNQTTLTNVTMDSNRSGVAGKRDQEHGGAIYVNTTSTLTANDSFIINNKNGFNLVNGVETYARTSDCVNSSGATVLITSCQSNGGGVWLGAGSTAVFNNTELSSNLTAQSGGGIYGSQGTNFTFINSLVANNQAATAGNQYGGGIYVYSAQSAPSSLKVYGSTITGNLAGFSYPATNPPVRAFNGSGGGIAVSSYATVTIQGSTQNPLSVISNNQSTQNGGGIQVGTHTTLGITDTTFSGNSAGTNGGAIEAVTPSAVTVTSSTLSGNFAAQLGGGVGGAIYLADGAAGAGNNNTLTVTSSEISDNLAGINNVGTQIYAGSGGGISAGPYSSISLDNTQVLRNKASQYGGGIHTSANGVQVENLYITLTNGTVVDSNSTATNNGGGVLGSTGSIITIAASSVTNNISGRDGGGVYVPNGSTIKLQNGTLVTDNHAADGRFGGGVYLGNATQDLPNSLVVAASTIARNKAGSGGGISAGNFTTVQIGTSDINNNTAVTDGGGMSVGVSATVALASTNWLNNTANHNGGGVLLWSGYGNMQVDGASVFQGNTATTGDGGAIWLNYAPPPAGNELAGLTIASGATFSGNKAVTWAPGRNAADDAVYSTNIHPTAWSNKPNTTTPDTNGYNNYDISYTLPTNCPLGFKVDANNPASLTYGIAASTSDTANWLVGDESVLDQAIATNASGQALDSAQNINIVLCKSLTLTTQKNIPAGKTVTITSDYGQGSPWSLIRDGSLTGAVPLIYQPGKLSSMPIQTSLAATRVIFDGNNVAGVTAPALSIWGGSLTLGSGAIVKNNLNASTANSAPAQGGGVFGTTNTIITVTDGAQILNNSALLGGGLLINSAATTPSTLNVTNGALIQGNTAGTNGGGIYLGANTNVTIDNASIKNNLAAITTVGNGGGIYQVAATSANPGTITLQNNTILSGNRVGIDATGNQPAYNTTTSSAIDGGGIWAGAYSTVNITSNSIVDSNWAFRDGGGIYQNGNGTVAVSGATVQNNRAGLMPDGTDRTPTHYSSGAAVTAADGGGIWVGNNSTVTVTNNSNIQGNLAGRNGGGILTGTPSNIEVTNSVVQNNRAAQTTSGSGGGIYQPASSSNANSLTLTNATITGNTTALDQNGNLTNASNSCTQIGGGGIYSGGLSASPTIVTGGQITGNMTACNGGGVYLSATPNGVTFDGTVIDSNRAAMTGAVSTYGGGIYLYNGSSGSPTVLTLQNGTTLRGNTAGYDVLNNVVQNSDISGVYAYGGAIGTGTYATINVGTGITVGGTNAGDGNMAYNSGGGIHTGSNVTVNLNSGAAIAGNSSIIGGGLLLGASSALHMASGSMLLANSAAQSGGGVYANAGSTIDVQSATIKNNLAAQQSAGNGGGIYQASNTASNLTLNNATITGNLAGFDANKNSLGLNGLGGGIAGGSATNTTITGGEISGNMATLLGGGIYLLSGGTTPVVIDGTLVQDNYVGLGLSGSTGIGGGICLQGGSAGAINALTLQNGAKVINNKAGINPDGSIATGNSARSSGAGIGTSAGNGIGSYVAISVIDAGAPDGTPTGTTISNNQAAYNGGGIYAGPNSTITLDGVTVNDNFAGLGAATESSSNGGSYGGGVYLGSIGTTSTAVTQLTMLNGAQITGNRVGLNDDGSQITTSTNVQLWGGGVWAGNYATVTLQDTSQISDNHTGQLGGGVYLGSSGTINLQGTSRISGNTANQSGGGIYTYGVATINVGDAPVAGAVASEPQALFDLSPLQLPANQRTSGFVFTSPYADSPLVRLLSGGNGAQISDNHALGILGTNYGDGGGIATGAAATITLNSGAQISNNTAAYRGGGIYTDIGSNIVTQISLTNAAIKNNKAGLSNTAGSGGGIYMANNNATYPATVTLNNSQISNNTTGYQADGTSGCTGSADQRSGGGIYAARNSNIIITGDALDNNKSQISGNKACGNGGGVSVQDNSIVTIDAGHQISGNTAGTTGGGLYIGQAGTVTSNGGVFDGNTAGTDGGAIWLYHPGNAVNLAHANLLGNTRITNNSAGGNGGGIWASYDGPNTNNDLAGVTAEAPVVFSGNTAATVVPTRNPLDNALYAANIAGTAWSYATNAPTTGLASNPFTGQLGQGYNNFDIHYSYNPQCPPGGVIIDDGPTSVTWLVGTEAVLAQALADGRPAINVVLCANVTLAAPHAVPAATDVTITSDGHNGADAEGRWSLIRGASTALNAAPLLSVPSGSSLSATSVVFDGASVANVTSALLTTAGGSITLGAQAVVKNNINTTGNGGGIYGAANSQITVTNNALVTNNKALNGGGIYMDSGYSSLGITGAAQFIGNSALPGSGGAVWVRYDSQTDNELAGLTVGAGATFSGNTASAAYPTRNSGDDEVYASNITDDITWSNGADGITPLTQGYNNYDIAYLYIQTCPPGYLVDSDTNTASYLVGSDEWLTKAFNDTHATVTATLCGSFTISTTKTVAAGRTVNLTSDLNGPENGAWAITRGTGMTTATAPLVAVAQGGSLNMTHVILDGDGANVPANSAALSVGTTDIPDLNLAPPQATIGAGAVIRNNNNVSVWQGQTGGGGIHGHNGAAIWLTDDALIENNYSASGAGVFLSAYHSGNPNTNNDLPGILYVRNSATIQNNHAINADASGYGGGGIFVAGTLDIDGGFITGNTTTGMGAGISLEDIGPNSPVTPFQSTISNAIIARNTADRFGGGLYFWQSAGYLTITGSTFDNNIAGSYGGGISLGSDTTAVFMDTVTVTNNSATTYGGGITVGSRAGELTIAGESLISNNAAITDGGGIRVANAGTLTLRHTELTDYVRVTNNTAGGNGGGIFIGDANTLNQSGIVSNNSAGSSGGGIYAGASATVSLNGNLEGNRASQSALGYGGGLYLGDGTAQHHATLLLNGTTDFNLNGYTCVPVDEECVASDVIATGFADADGGAIYASSYADITLGDSAGFHWNLTARNGGGIYVGPGSSLTSALSYSYTANSANTAGLNGGAIYLAPGYASAVISSARFDVNTAGAGPDGVYGGEYGDAYAGDDGGDGGAIWVRYNSPADNELAQLTVAADVEFHDNVAANGYVIPRNPLDNAVYQSNIAVPSASNAWSSYGVYPNTTQLPQGYNNYDISYAYNPQCPAGYLSTMDDTSATYLVGSEQWLGTALADTHPTINIILCSDVTLTAAKAVLANKTVAITSDGLNPNDSLGRWSLIRDTSLTGAYALLNVPATPASLSATNVIFDGNNVSANAPAIQVSGGSLTLGTGAVVQNSIFNYGGNNSLSRGGGIQGAAGSIITVTDGAQIINNTSAYWGGGIMIDSNATNISTLNITNGAIIDGNISGLSGGGIYLNQPINVLIDNATISNNQAAQINPGSGGGIYLAAATAANPGTITLQNGAIVKGNRASIDANGNPPIWSYSNVSESHGGGIWAGNYTTINLISGATIGGATAQDANWSFRSGGGIYHNGNGTVLLDNAKVQNNFAAKVADGNGGGIYMGNGAATTDAGQTVYTSKVIVQNNSVVSENFAGVALNDSPVVNPANNNANSYGGGIWAGAYASVTVTNSTVQGNVVAGSGGGVYAGTPSAVTVTNSAIQNNRAGVSLATTGGGGIYLGAGNATYRSTLSLDNAQVIGNTTGFHADGTVAYARNGDSLNNNNGGGILTGTLADVQASNGTNIASNRAGTSGGGIATDTGANVMLNNSTVTGNLAAQTYLGAGGGVWIGPSDGSTPSTLTIQNGSQVTGNYVGLLADGITAATNYRNSVSLQGVGAGIYVGAYTTVTLGTAETQDTTIITGNKALTSGGGLYLGGSAMGYLYPGTAVTANTAGVNGGGIYTGTSTTITVGDPAATASSAVEQWRVTDAVALPTVTMHGGGVVSTSSTTGIQAFASNPAAGIQVTGNTAASNGGGIYVSASATVDLTDVNIANNTATSAGGGGLYAGSTSTITLADTTVYQNTAGTGGGGIYVGTTSHLSLTDSFVQENTAGTTAAASGGGIYLDSGTATDQSTRASLELNNTSVTLNTATQDGGGIYTGSYTDIVLENDSEVSNNATVRDGGGMRIYTNSTALVQDSTFDINKAGERGGGIVVGTSTQIEVDNSTISNNRAGLTKTYADGNGGGIYLATANTVDTGAQVTVSNGAEVIGNTAGFDANGTTPTGISASGGGIFGGSYASVIMESGSRVTNNKAITNGGGIGIGSATSLDADGATISQNTVSNGSGGGISIGSGTLEIASSTISQNTASSNGAGIIMYTGSSADISDSTISDNTATIAGGGLYVYGNGTVTIGETTFDTNVAGTTNGGGIYLGSGSALGMTDSAVINNTATQSGGGIYAAAGFTSVNVSGVSAFTGNVATLDGGGIWVPYFSPANNELAKLFVGANVQFTGNHADDAYHEHQLGADDDIYQANIAATVWSADGSFQMLQGYNNYDIHYIYDPTCPPGLYVEDNDDLEYQTQLSNLLLPPDVGVSDDDTGIYVVGSEDWLGWALADQEMLAIHQPARPERNIILCGNVTVKATHAVPANTVVTMTSDEDPRAPWSVIRDLTLTGATPLLTVPGTLAGSVLTGLGLPAETPNLTATRVIYDGAHVSNVTSAALSVDTGGSLLLGSQAVVRNNYNVATGTVLPIAGGGINGAAGSTVTLTDGALVTGNSAAAGGGGIALDSNSGNRSTLIIANGASVTGNSSTGTTGNSTSLSGGGVRTGEYAAVFVTSGEISDNTAVGSGGGLAADRWSAVTLTDALVRGNSATANGGGLELNLYSNLLVDSSQVLSNTGGTTVNGVGGGIHLGDGTAMTRTTLKVQNGSLISGNSISNQGAGIYAGQYVDVSLLDTSVIRDNTARYDGAGIFTAPNSTLTIDGAAGVNPMPSSPATVSGNIAGEDGGGVYLDYGAELTMNHALVTGNTAARSGGGLYLYSGNTIGWAPIVDITASSITSNLAAQTLNGSGGGMYVGNGPAASPAEITLTDVTVTSNRVGILPSGAAAVNSSGSSVTGSGGGIYVGSNAVVKVDDAVSTTSDISFNLARTDGGGLWTGSGATVTLDGTTVTENVTGQNGGGVYMSGVSAFMADGATISSNLAGQRANGAGGGINIGAGEDGNPSTIILSNQTEITGNIVGLLADGLTAATYSNTDGTFLRTGSGGGIQAGNYAQIVLNSNSSVNGNIAANNGGGIYTGTYADVQVIGAFVQGNLAGQTGAGNGGGIYVGTTSSVKLNGAQVTDNKAGLLANGAPAMTNAAPPAAVPSDGGGVYVSASSTTIEVTNSAVSRNSVSRTGGGIYGDNAVPLTLLDSVISNNLAGQSLAGQGGGVYLAGRSPLTVKLINSQVTYNNVGLTASGDLAISPTGQTTGITGAGGGLYLGSQITVLADTISEVGYNKAKTTGGGIYLGTSASPTAPVSVSIIVSDTVDAASAADSIELLPLSGANSLSPYSLNAPGTALVHDNAALNGNGGGIYVFGNIITIQDLTVKDNTAAGIGGGIFVNPAGGTYGSSVATILDTLITQNTAAYGGGVGNSSGNATITLAGTTKVTTNTATSNGGGVYSGQNAPVNVNDAALVVNNTALGNGGGIYTGSLQTYLAQGGNSPVTLTGGSVTDNTAGISGGGIYVLRGITTDVTVNAGSTVSGNTANNNGGGIFAASGLGSVIVDGGVVENNRAGVGSAGLGGGIYVANGASNNLSQVVVTDGALISGNTAGYLTDGTLRAGDSDGGGIWAGSYSSTTISGATIQNNLAGRNGGGVYLGTGYTSMSVSGASAFIGNAAIIGDGGGIWERYASPSDNELGSLTDPSDLSVGLTVAPTVTFSGNTAATVSPVRNPLDDAVYASHIGTNGLMDGDWSVYPASTGTPLPQGYNNYDIAYHAAPLTVLKVNGATDADLVGASFELYTDPALTPESKVELALLVLPTAGSAGDGVTAWTAGLTYGATYYLVETRAPVGYRLLAEPIVVTVSSVGVITANLAPTTYTCTVPVDAQGVVTGAAVGSAGTGCDYAGDATLLSYGTSLFVRNYTGIPLPRAGGLGTPLWVWLVPLTLTGLTVLAVKRDHPAPRRRQPATV